MQAKNLCIVETTVKHCYGEIREVIVPDGITEIADGAFANHAYVEKVVLPNSLVKIGAKAFAWCESLREINIPDSVKYIGARAFIDCGMLKEISIGANVEEIGDRAFDRCSNLKKVTLPENLKKISDFMFHDCIRLSDVNMGAELEEIGECAFENTDIYDLCLGENIKKIGDFAFKNSSILSLEIPETMAYIGAKIAEDTQIRCFRCYAKSAQTGWAKDWNVNGNDSVWTVFDFGNTNGIVAGYDKQKLFIDGSVVKWCSPDVKEIFIPDGVTTIDDHAFNGCGRITKLSLPSSLNRLCDYVFGEGVSIKELEFRGTMKRWCEVEIYDRFSSPLSIASDVIIDGKFLGNLVIPEGVKKINNYAFMNKNFTSVKFPSSLKNIGYYAFYRCINLKEIELPDGLECVEDFAFAGCYNLVKIVLPRSAKVEENSFSNDYSDFFDIQIIYKD